MFLIAGILFAFGFNLFPTDFSKLPMELYSIPYRLRDYAWRDRDTFSNRVTRTLTDTGFATYERGLYENLATITLYYDSEGGNIFTASNLQKIQEIENDLRSSHDYSSYCMTYNASLECMPFKSIIRYFDGTFKSIDSVFDDPTFSNIPAVLHTALTNNQTSTDFEYFLPNSYTITATVASGSMTRSEMLIGCSLSGDMKCRSDSWQEKTKKFLADNVKEKLENHLGTSEFDFYYYGYYLWLYDVMQQAIKDMMCAIGSMIFIFIFMLIHTRSLFLTSLAVMSVFASFVGTEILYVGVIGFQYFGFFHILSIFIILGIGADDIFVFYDTWRLTAYSSYPSLAHRLSDAYSKSVLSMFITSLTTCVAFFSSAISPLLATRSFGVFSGLLIMYNYVSVIVYFPTVVIMYHLKFENWYCPCFRRCIKDENAKHNIQNTDKEKEKSMSSIESVTADDVYIIKKNDIIPNEKPLSMIGNGKVSCNESDVVLEKNIKNDLKNKESEQYSVKDSTVQTPTKQRNPVKKQKKLVIFFRDYYFRFVTHKVIRWILLPIFAVFVIVFGYQASKLEADNEQVSISMKFFGPSDC